MYLDADYRPLGLNVEASLVPALAVTQDQSRIPVLDALFLLDRLPQSWYRPLRSYAEVYVCVLTLRPPTGQAHTWHKTWDWTPCLHVRI